MGDYHNFLNGVWAIGAIVLSIWLLKLAVKGECEKGDRIMLFFGALAILVGALWILSGGLATL